MFYNMVTDEITFFVSVGSLFKRRKSFIMCGSEMSFLNMIHDSVNKILYNDSAEKNLKWPVQRLLTYRGSITVLLTSGFIATFWYSFDCLC